MTTEMDEIVLLTIGLRRPSNFGETYYSQLRLIRIRIIRIFVQFVCI